MNLKVISGVIYVILGLVGSFAVLFGSEAVTLPFTIIGMFGFMSLGSYGIYKLLNARVTSTAKFQINN